eukprot:TRINITY_DN1928_c0_g1_i3.p1 TRINITY_DN1928_c0_g1~~TRINITY_DN1928_c0_g1_i3.p1  ORF type:complete len:430 (-),score=36.40 TRINITY_DN1928_c0_g1_i3:267-1556(-)
MGLWSLFGVATMPVLQIVFIVFTPSLIFASLAQVVTLEDVISWWFMPINIGLTFLVGGILGWIVVRILKPESQLEGLIIATCSSGNLGNLVLIIVPAVCDENGSPFGEISICKVHGLSYASFSMALGSFFIWTYTYHLIKTAAALHKEIQYIDNDTDSKVPNKDFEANAETQLLKIEDEGPPSDQVALLVPSTKDTDSKVPNKDFEADAETHHLEIEDQGPPSDQVALLVPQVIKIGQRSSSGKLSSRKVEPWGQVKELLHRIVDKLLAPPTIGCIVGFVFGATPWLKSLIIGESAPLHVIQDSSTVLGNGTVPCVTLILGGNLTQGLRRARLRPLLIIAVICVRYMILPMIGLGVVKAAGELNFLPQDPLYRYVLMIQFTLPPAMNIGTMAQLFDVGQEECSVLFLWTYLVAAFALPIWSTVYLWILT